MTTDRVYSFSPSQVSTFRECERKWAFYSIDKIQKEQTRSAALGTEVHKQLETYLRGGSIDYTRESGYIAASGLHLLPAPPLPEKSIESKFRFQSPNTGFFYNGIRDVALPGKVFDHKTTGSLRWAKTPKDLDTDVQAIVYGYASFTKTVDLQWTYMQTKGAKKALPVVRSLTRDHIETEFNKIELTTARMRFIIDSGLKTLELPPSPDACEMYGGCPYRHICNLGPQDRLISFFHQSGEPIMGIADILQQVSTEKTEPISDPFAKDLINPPPFGDRGLVGYALDVQTAFDTPAPTAGVPKPAKPKEPKKTKEKEPKKEPVNVKEVSVELEVSAEPEHSGFQIFIDCVPYPAEYMDGATLIELAKSAVRDKTGLPDYRMVEYGQGPGLLATAMNDILASGEVKGPVYFSTSYAETLVCLSTLVEKAQLVVRSTR